MESFDDYYKGLQYTAEQLPNSLREVNIVKTIWRELFQAILWVILRMSEDTVHDSYQLAQYHKKPREDSWLSPEPYSRERRVE